MLREMENFINNLLKKNETAKLKEKSSLTYEAYAFALKQELSSIKYMLVNFEMEIIKQGIFFFYTL